MFSIRRLVTSVACAALCLLSATDAAYNVGIGKSDITGPAAEVVMMGYAYPDQKAAGLLNRLYARTYIIEDTDTNQRVVFVNCDVQGVFQLVHQEVIKQLKATYGGLYTEQNVVLHATHTHAGPGGSSAYTLFDFSIAGFINETFESIVAGIIKSITAAHNTVAPATISFNKGQLADGGRNRSPPAYLVNPAAERAQYPSGDRDIDMRALQFRGLDGTLRGVLAWYPVHPTSLTEFNHLISGDNKGYAEFLLEEQFPGAIVGIGISNAADVSPNRIDNGNGTFRGEGKDDIESCEIIGGRQAKTLLSMLTAPSEQIKGSVVGKLSYVNFSNVTLKGVTPTADKPYADRTCPAIVGQNFAAGTEDGRGLATFTEGELKANPLFAAVGAVLKDAPQWVKDCQTKNKVQLLAVGLMEPVPWVPEVLPVQVIKIGQFGIAVTNFETSTMSGRRIRASVKAALAPAGVTEVEVASISNAYAQYMTTAEEYSAQHYEGASTVFGPNQLAAVQQELGRVAASIADPSIELDVGPTPRQFDRKKLVNFQTGVLFDTVPGGKKYGDVRVQPKASYAIGATASADFFGAHPKNRLMDVASFCDVEMQTASGSFETVMTDAHWDVRYKWFRDSIADSKSICEWNIRPGGRTSVAGTYRFRHRGFSKPLIGSITPYEGVSATFTVA